MKLNCRKDQKREIIIINKRTKTYYAMNISIKIGRDDIQKLRLFILLWLWMPCRERQSVGFGYVEN